MPATAAPRAPGSLMQSPKSLRRTAAPRIERRRLIDPTTCERDYAAEELEFIRAIDAYKRASGRMFPTCSEILEVVRSLGYARPATG